MFRGTDEMQVMERFLRYIVEKETELKVADFERIADEVEEEAPPDIGQIAEEFAEGGMSQFGLEIEAARLERLDLIGKALRESDLVGQFVVEPLGVLNLEELLPEIRAKTDLSDLDVMEIAECIRRVGVDNLIKDPADATIAVVPSSDKLN